MVERGSRPVSDDLSAAALKVLSLPATARPIEDHLAVNAGEEFFKRALGELGYPGLLTWKVSYCSTQPNCFSSRSIAKILMLGSQRSWRGSHFTPLR